MRLAQFLTEVALRNRTQIPTYIDSVGIILARVGLQPHMPESRALTKATLAMIAGTGEMTEADLWALSQDALGLIETFALDLLADRYRGFGNVR
jgi:hypothetical protein